MIRTAGTGLVTSAGVAIAPGTLSSAAGSGMDSQILYGKPTKGKRWGWRLGYDNGDESALLVTFLCQRVAGEDYDALGIVGQGLDAGTFNGRPGAVRIPVDTFLENVYAATVFSADHPDNCNMAALYIDTEAVAIASATGTLTIGFVADVAGLADALPVTLGSEVVDVVLDEPIEVKTGSTPLMVDSWLRNQVL